MSVQWGRGCRPWQLPAIEASAVWGAGRLEALSTSVPTLTPHTALDQQEGLSMKEVVHCSHRHWLWISTFSSANLRHAFLCKLSNLNIWEPGPSCSRGLMSCSLDCGGVVSLHENLQKADKTEVLGELLYLFYHYHYYYSETNQVMIKGKLKKCKSHFFYFLLKIVWCPLMGGWVNCYQ